LYKILIVDDEVEIRNGLYHCNWKELGFTPVGSVCNGLEALEFINANPVDVVLCDVMMPKLNGIEFSRIIHERKLNIKIVFLSGYSDFDYVKEAMKYGGKDYLLKPTKFKQLEKVFIQLKQELDDELIGKYSAESKTSDENNMIIEYAHRFVEQHISTVTLEQVAEFVHLSPQYFSRYYKEKTGTNFSDYVMEQRMKLAEKLLKDIRKKTYEIAYETGYNNPKNFTRAFKAYFGESPSEYRKNNRKNACQ